MVNMVNMDITGMVTTVRMSNGFLPYLLLFLLLLLSYNPLYAKDIESNASIATTAYYSDNIDLYDDSDKDKENSLVFSITPSISFSKEGNRVKTNLDYSFTGLLYLFSNDNSEVQHNLNSNIASEIVKNTLFLDLDAGISQILLNPNNYSDNVSGTQNQTQTYTYGFSPYWTKKWGSYINSELRYNYNQIIYDHDNDDAQGNSQNSQQDNISLDISSGAIFRVISWNINYNYSNTSYEESTSYGYGDTTAETINLVLGYNYSRKLSVRLTTGYEDYHSTDNISPNGVDWAIGLHWSPNPRNSLDFDIGYRFYGTSYNLNYHHVGKRFNWDVTYTEDITNQRDSIRNTNHAINDNPDNINPPIASNNDNGRLYLSRTGRSNLNYSYHKSTLTWGVYHERSYYSDVNNEEDSSYGTDLSWGLRVGKRTTMNTNVSWSVTKDLVAQSKQTRNSLQCSLNRQISRKTSGYIEISYQNNDSDIQTNTYTENKISIGLSQQF